MRLATILGGPRPRDGQLVAVLEDGTTMRPVENLSMRDALDDGLDEAALTARLGPEEPFDPAAAMAPLPRAPAFLDGSAYVNHVALVRRARGAAMPDSFWHDPLMYEGCAAFAAPTAPIPSARGWGTDCEAEVAVITADVPMGASEGEAAAAIRLVTLVNDVSLRGLIPGELAKGFGFVQSKPPSAMAPVAVTPDALPGWDGRRLSGALHVDVDGAPLGRVEAGADMTFDFGRLVAHAARTRPLWAGTVVGSGTVSNLGQDGGPGLPVAEGGAGYACIAEQRTVETIRHGVPATSFLVPGMRVRIWMDGAPFGAIDQEVRAYEEPA